MTQDKLEFYVNLKFKMLLGVDFEGIDKRTKWIAMDHDGTIWEYDSKPIRQYDNIDDVVGVWTLHPDAAMRELESCVLSPEHTINWTESLISIEEFNEI